MPLCAPVDIFGSNTERFTELVLWVEEINSAKTFDIFSGWLDVSLKFLK